MRGLGGLSTSPLVVLWAGIMCHTLLLLPTTQKWQLGLGLSASSCPQFAPVTHAHSYFCPFQFLCICCWRKRLSRCQLCSREPQVPGPSLSQQQIRHSASSNFSYSLTCTLCFSYLETCTFHKMNHAKLASVLFDIVSPLPGMLFPLCVFLNFPFISGSLTHVLRLSSLVRPTPL